VAAVVQKAMQAAGVAVTPDDLLSIVDAVYLGEGGQWDIDGEEGTVALKQKAMLAAGIGIFPDDIARVVDAAKLGATGPRGNIQRGEDFAAQQKAVGAPGVAVASDNLAVIVDASCNGATRGRGIIEGDEAAAAQQETVLVVTRIDKRSDDHARVVDAKCPGKVGAKGSSIVVKILTGMLSPSYSRAVVVCITLAISGAVAPSTPTSTLAKHSTSVKTVIRGDLHAFPEGASLPPTRQRA
jgi:hypothetical protein